jgi:serine/threonine protein kinase
VALKILRPETGLEPEFAERFAREARAMAKLNHSAIVTVHDFGRKDGMFYFIMEFPASTQIMGSYGLVRG